MKVDRKQIKILRSFDKQTEEPAQMSKSEAISFVWELTKEVYSISGKFDVESRLQRDVVSIIRKQS